MNKDSSNELLNHAVGAQHAYGRIGGRTEVETQPEAKQPSVKSGLVLRREAKEHIAATTKRSTDVLTPNWRPEGKQ